MPRDAHISAAYHHERAAKSHRAAAEQSTQGAHQACEEHAVTACGHATKADEASKLALDKSVQRTKAVK
ncbi:MAG TPA: hypothetical protein VGQ49_21710 [Bryobacteraceae bacterium]|jgi:hypothetical protein|nr:hypothetical protein [Bryobacteraceae bacterium]